MCVSLDEPEPVDSVLTFLSGYDTLKYSWVKAYDDIRALADFIRDATRRQHPLDTLPDIFEDPLPKAK